MEEATDTYGHREGYVMNVQCCFCAAAIKHPDQVGVRLTFESMGDGTAQSLFAHIACLETRFAPILAAETVFYARAFESN